VAEIAARAGVCHRLAQYAIRLAERGTYPEGGVHYRFFDVMVDPESRRYLSEDYGFCRLWEKIGGEIYVDANSDLSHQGERLYTGDFAATLRSALPSAVGAPEGQRMSIKGLENLKRNL
jgi:hypothetical protein